jgi:hypothetical protein
MYFVEPSQWIWVATMQVSGAAACWLQSLDPSFRSGSWGEFCRLVLDRFGKDQHEVLLRQLLHIRQTAGVQEYADHFTKLVDQLLAYGKNKDPLFYAMRFVDGLRDDIRSAVQMQRPPTVDTSMVLALLQEELVDPSRRRDGRRSEGQGYARLPPRGAVPLPLPPQTDKGGRALVGGYCV